MGWGWSLVGEWEVVWLWGVAIKCGEGCVWGGAGNLKVERHGGGFGQSVEFACIAFHSSISRSEQQEGDHASVVGGGRRWHVGRAKPAH